MILGESKGMGELGGNMEGRLAKYIRLIEIVIAKDPNRTESDSLSLQVFRQLTSERQIALMSKKSFQTTTDYR
jgi:hypothetical protein